MTDIKFYKVSSKLNPELETLEVTSGVPSYDSFTSQTEVP